MGQDLENPQARTLEDVATKRQMAVAEGSPIRKDWQFHGGLQQESTRLCL